MFVPLKLIRVLDLGAIFSFNKVPTELGFTYHQHQFLRSCFPSSSKTFAQIYYMDKSSLKEPQSFKSHQCLDSRQHVSQNSQLPAKFTL